MTFDRWLALVNVAWPILLVVLTAVWRILSRIERRLDSIEELGRFHHQVLAWHDAAIDRLEERKTG